MERKKCILLIAILTAMSSVGYAQMEIWENVPAQRWTEAYPVGNGFMGAMMYGDPKEEHIQFNEESLCTGNIQKMGNYQPFGDLYIEQDVREYSDYRRVLSLEDAICRVNFTANGVRYSRELLVSNPDGVVALRLTASRKGTIDALLRLTSRHEHPISYQNNEALFTGEFDMGLQYAALVRVVAEDGEVTATDKGLQLKRCSRATILLKAATSYVQDYERRFLGENPLAGMRNTVDGASKLNWKKLLKRHVSDHQSLYNNFSLTLGQPCSEQKPLSQLLAAYDEGKGNSWLEALLCQYGRYLMIGSSRPGSLPANLQGVWNNDMKPAWYSQYTTNINLEMNYWGVEQTGLSACHDQMLRWVETIATVQRNTDDPRLKTDKAWKAYSTMNTMGGSSRWAIHLPGPAWMLQHFWTHYLYTGDKEFLRQRAYPLLREMVDFWVRRLVLNKEGRYITPDGWSPEHGPGMVEGDRTPMPGASYDQEIVYDLFSNYLAAADTLHLHDEFYQQVKNKCDSLLWPQIGRWGQLQEWMEDVDSPEDHHRHQSHLFAVYPGHQITPLRTPQLAAAALKSLEARGDHSVGWSTAWRISLYAHLAKPELAYRSVQKLIKNSLFHNLFSNYDLHSSQPFQIDANFGYLAGVAEMLLQSDGDRILLLPALPKAWNDGEVKGIRAVGGFVFDMKWRDGRIVSLRLTSTLGGKCHILLPDGSERVIDTKIHKQYQLI